MENAARSAEDGFTVADKADANRNIPHLNLPGPLPSMPLMIADMADLFGVTHRTLHFYEEKGLICAGRAGATRVYSHEDVMRMAVVSACREGGMPIASIQDMMASMEKAQTPEEAERIFREALLSCKRELTAGISTIRRQMQQLENLLHQVVPENEASENDRPSLGETELECLRLMARGLPGERIAPMLGVTPLEAAALERDVITRLNASNRSQAVTRALITGLITE